MSGADSEHVEGMVQLISDTEAPWSTREDAINELRRWNESLGGESPRVWCSDAVLSALARVATNESELPTLQDAAGEALAVIWMNRRVIDSGVYPRLASHARAVVDDMIRLNAPELRPPSTD
jgi:hypothetical protein